MAEVALAALAAEAREAIDNEDFDRAARACLRALRRFPRWVEGYWLLGQVLIEREYAAEARACFEAVASAQPDDPRAYEGLAAVAEQRRDLATAIAGLARAVEVGETSQGVQGELNNLLRQTGRSGLELATNARAAHARLLEGQFEAADLAAERALRDEPDRLDLLLVQTVARILGDDRGGALGSGERLLDLSPDCLKALAVLQHLTSGQRREGYAAELAALDPEGHTLVWLRGQVAARGGDAGELPGEPRVVTWTEDTAESTLLAGRPLDRLLPELEQALPQWLRDAAASPTVEPMPATPATSPDAPAPEAALPSVLGDVESLVREFEEALQAAPPAPAAAASPGESAFAPASQSEDAAPSQPAAAPTPTTEAATPAAVGADQERRAAAEAALSAWNEEPAASAPALAQEWGTPGRVEAAAATDAYPAASAAPAEAEIPVSAVAAQPEAAEPWSVAAPAADLIAPRPTDEWGASDAPVAPPLAVDEFGLPATSEAGAGAATAAPEAAKLGIQASASAPLAPEAAHPEQATVAAAPEVAGAEPAPAAEPAWATSSVATEPAFGAWETAEASSVSSEATEEVPPLVNISDWEAPPAIVAADAGPDVAPADEAIAKAAAPAGAWEQAASDAGTIAVGTGGSSTPVTVASAPDPFTPEWSGSRDPAAPTDFEAPPAPVASDQAPTAAPAATSAPVHAGTPVAGAGPADHLRADAFAAAHTGDYLTAVAKLGDALAALRGARSENFGR